MGMDQAADVFLCHNKADKAWTRALGERLEAETIDGLRDSRKIRVFFDEWDIDKGENFVLKLGKALSQGGFLAAVLSPEFFESGWTTFEWTDVIAKDPSNRDGRLLPLRRRDASLDGARRVSLPAPFNALNYFDFRDDKDFEAHFSDLLRRVRNEPAPRGSSPSGRYDLPAIPALQDSHVIHAPYEIDEVLVSNLAPVTAYPARLYYANSKLTSIKEVPAQIDVGQWTFRFWDGKLLTFANLEDPECSLNKLIDPYTIETATYDACMRSSDWTTQWLALANKVLGRHLYDRHVVRDDKKRFLFRPGVGGTNRTVTIPGQRPKDVAAKKRHHVSGEDFWVHYSASMRFTLLGAKPFLRVLPSYAFTSDGSQALENKLAGRFKVIWGGRQDSAAVLRLVLFWLLYLSDGHEVATIDSGSDPFTISVMPAAATTSVGVHADHIRIKALVEQEPDAELDMVASAAQIDAAEGDDLPLAGEVDD